MSAYESGPVIDEYDDEYDYEYEQYSDIDEDEYDDDFEDNFFEEAMQWAITQHNTRESQLASIQTDFEDILGHDAARDITAQIMGVQTWVPKQKQAPPNIKDTINRVMKTHNRKISQFESLKDELGLVFDEDEATRIAKQTMKEMNPNNTNPKQIDIENIVSSAKKQHKRKVSQFEAVKHDIKKYFPNEEDSTQLAAQIMKEFNPNKRSGIHEEISIDSIVNKAVTQHKRKISQFRSVENDLGLIFDAKDVKNVTKDVMKQIFAQKHKGVEIDEKQSIEQMKKEIEELEDILLAKDKEIETMKQIKADIVVSKNNLVINSNRALDEMRGYLLQYQRNVFKSDS